MDTLQSKLALLKDRMAARDRDGVNGAALGLIAAEAPIGPQYATLARLLQHNGEHDAALRALDAWRSTGGPSQQITFERAAVLARAGRSEEARRAADALAHDYPHPAANAYLKGTLAHDSGDRAVAMIELSRAVALNPGSGQSWLARVMAGPLDAAEETTLQGQQARFAGINTVDSAAYFYALGNQLDQRREYDAAFAAFAHGARIMEGLRPFDSAADAALASKAIEHWTDDALADARAAIRQGKPSPIFVTGLPRSGTTLVEQILASHSAVAGGAETSLFSIIGRDVGGLSHQAFQSWRARGGDPQALRDLYHHLASQRFPAPGRIVDKTLGTSRYLGLIAALFPDAPIIWLRRDPLDCAWSVFRNYFLKGVDWSWSLPSITQFFAQEDRLFDHWTRLFGEQILVVPFEQLVSDPVHWTNRIDDHVGLTLEPAQHSPHRTDRLVATSSAAQVREAIHQRGIGSAAPYRQHLAESATGWMQSFAS